MTHNIIITGAAGGIGSSIAQLFLNKNYQVIGIDKNSGISHKNYTHYACDVSHFKKLEAILQSISYCDDNALINCVGIREICSISALSIEMWEKIISINVSAVFVASKTFSEKIKNTKTKASIVNIASISGLLGEPDRTAYVTSKHAVIGLTKQLAIEYGKFGIRANAIAPGVIRTPLTESYYEDAAQLKKIHAGQFINYLATPEDVTPLVDFLVSDKAQFITGSTFVVDGGWTAGKLL